MRSTGYSWIRALLLWVSIANAVTASDINFDTILRRSTPARPQDPIPRLVHFVYGLKRGVGEFEYFQYLAIKSAYENIKPDDIWVWLHYEPEGPWWAEAKKYIKIKSIDTVDSVYGRPIQHFAHRADVQRLKVLHEYGGIYLDMDVLSLKSFDNLLVNNSFVMGHEGAGGDIGLCNAVMISQPRAPFLRRWMEAYKSFDGIVWAWHSVSVPSHLSKAYPQEITILNHTAFFWPLWNEVGLQKMYMEKSYSYEDNYAVHLWESNARHWFLNQLTPDLVSNVDISLFCEIRKLMSPASPRGLSTCTAASPNMYADGAVALYTFDDDILDTRRIEDSLGNKLNGWAINGTQLIDGLNGSGKARAFRGMGDFAVLPLPASMSMEEFSFQGNIRFGDLCQGAASIVALQSYAITILVEGSCIAPKRTLWLKVFRSLQPEDAITNITLVSMPAYDEGDVITISLRGSSTLGRLELLAEHEVIVNATWPPPGESHKAAISNIWLGARPASPFPHPHRKTSVHDFRGAMDNIIVFDKYMDTQDLQRANTDPLTFFQRHIRLAGSVTPSEHAVNVDFDPVQDALSLRSHYEWTDADKFTPTLQAHLPIFLSKVLPLHTSAWTVSFTIEYAEEFVPKLALASGGVIPAPSFLEMKFDQSKLLGVTYDLVTGQLLVKQWGYGWPAYLPVSKYAPCGRSTGSNLFMHMSLGFDTVHERVSLYCNGQAIFQRTIPYASGTVNPRITTLSTDLGRLQLRAGAPDSRSPSLDADHMLDDKVSFVAEVAGHRYNVDSSISRSSPIVLPVGAVARDSLVLQVASRHRIERLEPRLSFNSSSSSSYFEEPLTAKAIRVGKNKFQISTSPLQCRGKDAARVHLVIPELFAHFSLQVECAKPGSAQLRDLLGDPVTAPGSPSTYGHNTLLLLSVIGAAILFCLRLPIQSMFISADTLNHKGGPTQSGRKVSSYWIGNRKPRRSLWSPYSILFFFLVVLGTGHLGRSSKSSIVSLGFPKWQAFSDHEDYDVSGGLGGKIADANLSSNMTNTGDNATNRPFFTVITPCYQQRAWLADAAQSLFEQTYPHFEWLIVDDGSPDACYLEAEDIKRAHPEAAIRVIRKANGGLAHSRNVAISQARTDWVCLLDADDRLDPSYLELAADTISANSTVTAINSNQQFFGESNWVFDLEPHSPTLMLYKGLFPTQTIFRKQDWLKVGGFEPTLPWGNEDWSFWIGLSFLDDFKVQKLPGSLLFYRFKSQSMQREKDLYKECYPMMMTLHWDKYSKAEISLAHDLIGRWASPRTVQVVDTLSKKFPSRRAPLLWKGIFAEQRGNYEEAMRFYRQAQNTDLSGTDWQPNHRMQVVAAKIASPPAYYGM